MTEARGGRGAQPDPGPVAIGDLMVARLKEARGLRGWGTVQLAEQLAKAGAPRLTANVLQNIEAGRRAQAVQVEELLILALVLGVPGEFFLAPHDDERLRLLPGITPDRELFLSWLRGEQPSPGADAERYREVSAQILPPVASAVDPALREEFAQRALDAFDGFFTASDQVVRKTREQVRQLLTDIKASVEGGASAQELTAQLDQYLEDLPR